MADLITKIGADSSQLRNDVTAAAGVVKKQFNEMKTASEGGISDNVKGLKKSFNDLKDLVVGGGIIAAVQRFYDVAIESANKSTDANDANAAAVRRFGEAMISLKDTLGSAAVAILGPFNRLGEAIGEAINIAREGWDAWAEGQDKLEATAAAAAEVEKASAAAKVNAEGFKKVTEGLLDVKKQEAALALQGISKQETLNNLTNEFFRIGMAVANAEGDKLTQRKLELELAQAALAMHKAQLDVRKEEAQDAEKAAAKQADRSKRAALATDEQIELERILAKTGAQRTKDEQARLEVLQLQTGEKRLHAVIEDLLEKKITKGITPAEQATLNELIKQDETLKDQIAKKTALTAVTDVQTAGEVNLTAQFEEQYRQLVKQGLTRGDITTQLKKNSASEEEMAVVTTRISAEVERQVNTLEAQGVSREQIVATVMSQGYAEADILDVMNKQADAQERVRREKEMVKSLGVSFESDFSGMSSEAIQGVIDRNRQKASDLVNPALNYQRGGPVMYLDKLEAARLNAEAFNAEKELRQRTEVQSYAKTYGEDAALRQYGDSITQKALQNLNDLSVRATTAQESLVEILRKSKLMNI